MVNLVLFYCDRMRGFFGLGAHVEELLTYFRKQRDIQITIIYTETSRYRECQFVQENGLDKLYIPCPENGLFLTTEESLPAKTLAERILQIAYPFLKDKKNLVCWFNSIAELNIVTQIRDFFKCKIFYVHHGWSWKDHIRVENDVFAAEWKRGNVNFSPKAFEYTNYQLQMVECADRTITVTEQAKSYFETAFGIPTHKLITILNGIDPLSNNKYQKSIIRNELGVSKSEKLILFSGRVIDNKGIFFLIDGFKLLLKKYPRCRLVLIGTGSLGKVLAAAMPIWSKIIVTGFLSKEWLQKWYTIADIGILPSLMEQCSYTAIEMRFWRIPIIVSAVDGLDEMFENEKDCLKIPVHYDENGERILKPSEISDCLYRLLTNQSICQKLSENGYKRGVESFKLEKMGEKYLGVIRSMTSDSDA